jgi:hypothetical protein
MRWERRPSRPVEVGYERLTNDEEAYVGLLEGVGAKVSP